MNRTYKAGIVGENNGRQIRCRCRFVFFLFIFPHALRGNSIHCYYLFAPFLVIWTFGRLCFPPPGLFRLFSQCVSGETLFYAMGNGSEKRFWLGPPTGSPGLGLGKQPRGCHQHRGGSAVVEGAEFNASTYN